MSDKIVSLAETRRQKPVEAIVLHLEDLLRKARKGQVRGMGYCTVNEIGGTFHAYVFGDANCITLVGAAHLMDAAITGDVAAGATPLKPDEPEPA